MGASGGTAAFANRRGNAKASSRALPRSFPSAPRSPTVRLAGRGVALALTFAAAPAFAQVSVSITSTPANSIVGAGTWRTGGLTAINRSHGALGNQSSHRVFGSPVYISATSPAALTEANLNGATVTVSLAGRTFASGVSASSFALESTVNGLSVGSVTGGASGSTDITTGRTASTTSDVEAGPVALSEDEN